MAVQQHTLTCYVFVQAVIDSEHEDSSSPATQFDQSITFDRKNLADLTDLDELLRWSPPSLSAPPPSWEAAGYPGSTPADPASSCHVSHAC